MEQFKDCKEGLVFEETSHKLKHATLKQRGSQETRWARADLAAKRNFFRNSPTIFICLGQKMEKYRLEGDSNQTEGN